jgi:hypothetical protein
MSNHVGAQASMIQKDFPGGERPRRLRRLTCRAKPRRLKPQFAPECHSDDSDLQALRQAWEIAARAGANAPGMNIAYYDLEVAACHFHGER